MCSRLQKLNLGSSNDFVVNSEPDPPDLVLVVATLKSQKCNLRDLSSVRPSVNGLMIDIVRVDDRDSPREELWTGSGTW